MATDHYQKNRVSKKTLKILGMDVTITEIQPTEKNPETDYWLAKKIMGKPAGKNPKPIWWYNPAKLGRQGHWEFFEIKVGLMPDIAIVNVVRNRIGSISLVSDLILEQSGEQTFSQLENYGDDAIEKIKKIIKKRKEHQISVAQKAADELRRKEIAKKVAKQRRREERKKEIRSREPMHFYREDGKRYWGIPVEAEEWESLNDGDFAVLMENGEPQEAFVVKKSKGKARKSRFRWPVYFQKPGELEEEKIRIPFSKIWVVAGEKVDKAVYIHQKHLELVKEHGLPSEVKTIDFVSDQENSEFLEQFVILDGVLQKIGEIRRARPEEIKAGKEANKEVEATIFN